MTLKNITFSAEAALIERARQRARAERTTLNAEFRRWLAQYADRTRSQEEFRAMMAELDYAEAGRSFDRDELNERILDARQQAKTSGLQRTEITKAISKARSG